MYQEGCSNSDHGMHCVFATFGASSRIFAGMALLRVASTFWLRPSSRIGATSDLYIMQMPPQSEASAAIGVSSVLEVSPATLIYADMNGAAVEVP